MAVDVAGEVLTLKKLYIEPKFVPGNMARDRE